MARQIAVGCDADGFRIFDLTDVEVGSEEPPFDDQESEG